MARSVDNVTSHGALLDETLALVTDARTYLNASAALRLSTAAEDMLLAEAGELSRLSARVSYCLSWLIAREAVRRGELPPARAHEADYRLGGGEGLANFGAETDCWVSAPLAALAARGRDLYERMARLDGRLGPPPSAAAVAPAGVRS